MLCQKWVLWKRYTCRWQIFQNQAIQLSFTLKYNLQQIWRTFKCYNCHPICSKGKICYKSRWWIKIYTYLEIWSGFDWKRVFAWAIESRFWRLVIELKGEKFEESCKRRWRRWGKIGDFSRKSEFNWSFQGSD